MRLPHKHRRRRQGRTPAVVAAAAADEELGALGDQAAEVTKIEDAAGVPYNEDAAVATGCVWATITTVAGKCASSCVL